MSSLGLYLRELRQRQGLTLEDVSRATRVATRYLEALEVDDLASLPAPVFTKGFLRAYCLTLKVPPDEAFALYARQAHTMPPPAAAAAVAAERRPDPAASSGGTVLVSFVLMVVFGLALFLVTLLLQSGRETSGQAGPGAPEAPPPVVAGPSEPEAALDTPALPADADERTAEPAGDSLPPGAVDPGATVGPVSSAYRLVARVSEPTWVRVRTVEGGFTEETIPAGEVREWVSNAPLILTIGNAGGIALELNGRPLPLLGSRGAVISRLVIPPPQQ
jgi:cytoskeleton protein RodZ